MKHCSLKTISGEAVKAVIIRRMDTDDLESVPDLGQSDIPR